MNMVKDEFEFDKITWQPFFLNSTIPKEGYTYQEYFAKKGMHMTEEKIAQFATSMKPTADSLGISFINGRRMYNTRQSHRLFEWTKQNHPELMNSSALPKILFKSYFTHGKNISDTEVLVNIAKEAGVGDCDAVRTMLSDPHSEPSNESIDKADRYSKSELGVDGVPFFVMNGVPAFSGGQPEESFIKVFRWLKANNRYIRKY